MTKMQKLALVGLVGLLPLGALADGDHRYGFGFDDDRSCMVDSRIMKNANYQFEGKIEKMPTSGFNGKWLISGQEILVDDNTKIFQESHQMRLKDELKVIAQRVDGAIKALVIVHED